MNAAADAPAIEVNGCTHRYPDGQLALQDVDLTVGRGERVAILGPNGAGKTTLMLHLNGILRPTTGAVRIDGLAVAPPHLADIRRRVGLVFQDPDDQLFMPTVGDDVAFGPSNLGLRGAELAARVDHALTAVGMAEHRDRQPHHLSFGQRRRVALATVLAMDPTILALDEPSSNLDPRARREFADLLLGLNQTIVLVTHDLLYALQLCPRSVVMAEGRIIADGATRTLLADTELMDIARLELPYGVVLEP